MIGSNAWYIPCGIYSEATVTFLAKISMHRRSRVLSLPKGCRFEVREVKPTQLGERVTLEPSDAATHMPWAAIDAIGNSMFISDGRDQPAMPESRVVFEP